MKKCPCAAFVRSLFLLNREISSSSVFIFKNRNSGDDTEARQVKFVSSIKRYLPERSMDCNYHPGSAPPRTIYMWPMVNFAFHVSAAILTISEK